MPVPEEIGPATVGYKAGQRNLAPVGLVCAPSGLIGASSGFVAESPGFASCGAGCAGTFPIAVSYGFSQLPLT